MKRFIKNSMSKESKMGRPKQSADEHQKKVDTIIETAQLLFISEGYESVSMRKIAAKAGMGTMTLYMYFSNKNAILHHIWAGFFDELLALIQADLEKKQGAKAKLKQMCMTYLNYWVVHKERFHIVFLNEDRASSEDDFFINNTDVSGQMLLIAGPLIQEFIKSDEDEPILLFLESLMCLVHGIALNVITISEYPWHNYEKYVDIFLGSTSQAPDGVI